MNSDPDPAEEQRWRAEIYNLLAKLIEKPPDSEILGRLTDISCDETDTLGSVWNQLSQAAKKANPENLRTEHHQLFIGITRGEVLPYASWYLTGFLMEKPLVQIRKDLAAIGIKRKATVKEPEDHISALFEVMTLLIRGGDLRQFWFYERNIGPWASRLFQDIGHSRQAVFYRSVARLGSAFLHLESELAGLPD